MDEERKRLLIELEDIIGHQFYKAKIQNQGPGGVFEGEGRAVRYPVTLCDKDDMASQVANGAFLQDKLRGFLDEYAGLSIRAW